MAKAENRRSVLGVGEHSSFPYMRLRRIGVFGLHVHSFLLSWVLL